MGCQGDSPRSQQLHCRRRGSPAIPVLPLLQLVVILLLSLVGGCLAGTRHPYSQRLLDMRSSIVEALGLAGIPDVAKANVSQAEYERAHNEYLSKLRHNREARYQRSLLTLRASDIETATASSVNLSFPLADKEEQIRQLDVGNCSLESALLRLLLRHHDRDDSSQDSLELELRVYDDDEDDEENERRPKKTARPFLARRGLRGLAPSQLRWLQLELPAEEMERALLRGWRRPRLRLRAQLLAVAPNGEDRVLSVSEAALNLQLACVRKGSGPGVRPRRSPRRGGAVDELWSMHKGRRTECKTPSGSGPGAKKCCRHEMSVNFAELEGFDFIIQPKSFDAGFCKGRCPPRYNPAHHHALLQSLIWKGDRTKAPRPCCAPSKLAELEILYFDENEPTKLKVSNWKDMRVLECACS